MSEKKFDIKKLGKELKAASTAINTSPNNNDQGSNNSGNGNSVQETPAVIKPGDEKEQGIESKDQLIGIKDPVINSTEGKNDAAESVNRIDNPDNNIGLKSVPNLTAETIEFFINQVLTWERPKNDTKTTIQLDPMLYGLLAQVRLATKIPGVQLVNYLVTEFFRKNPDFLDYVQKKASSNMLGGADMFK